MAVDIPSADGIVVFPSRDREGAADSKRTASCRPLPHGRGSEPIRFVRKCDISNRVKCRFSAQKKVALSNPNLNLKLLPPLAAPLDSMAPSACKTWSRKTPLPRPAAAIVPGGSDSDRVGVEFLIECTCMAKVQVRQPDRQTLPMLVITHVRRSARGCIMQARFISRMTSAATIAAGVFACANWIATPTSAAAGKLQLIIEAVSDTQVRLRVVLKYMFQCTLTTYLYQGCKEACTQADEAMQTMREMMGKLKLTVNEKKSAACGLALMWYDRSAKPQAENTRRRRGWR